MRLIDADKTIEALETKRKIRVSGDSWSILDDRFDDGIVEAIRIVEYATTVEERKHGHWGKDDYKCSVCGAKRPTTDTASKWIYLDQRYCYNCGAAMDEEAKADE